MKAFPYKVWIPVACMVFFTCKAPKVPVAATSRNAPQNNAAVSGEKFSEHVRTTEFQTPDQEKAGFRLPPGFEITLFASEPDITKPINMEFDAAGRLWVSQSSEYPMSAPPGTGHDRITVLEDTNGDGRADKFTPFATDLDIPIGVMPVRGGAIGFSIPNVYRFIDTDGDGKYDNKKVLFGPFGYIDTHGMVSNLMRSYDGWIHACHGFTNTSKIAGTDGDSLTMVSGNTFRFKEDGSRVEQTTYGRVNPFGFSVDEWGYLYSVDCHSKPIYQLIKGAEYPHFGRKSPAIGFAPEMMSYELGSTALSGLVYYIGTNFPQEYQNSFYNGDVVTCRINRNNVAWEGSSPVAKRQEDFLVSSDPWFRPVNIKMGPDGAMYVADFYNRIIGHYEVPLNHPGRDRQSGRIWKITYVGDKKATPQTAQDWTKAPLKDLIANLNYPQLNIRIMIANEIVDRFGKDAVAPIIKSTNARKLDHKALIQSLWILHRLAALPDAILDRALQNSDPMVQTHALRVVAEKKIISPKQRELTLKALNSSNANVQRMAAEAAAAFPQAGNVKTLLSLYASANDADKHLKYTALISLRQNLRNGNVMRDVAAAQWNDAQLAILIKVISDVPSEAAASFALDYLRTHQMQGQELTTLLEHISRYVSNNRLDEPVAIIQKQYESDGNTQFQLYQTMQKGIAQKGGQVNPVMRNWAVKLAQTFLKSVEGKDGGWWHTNIEHGWVVLDPWNRVNRAIIKDKPPVDMIWSEYDWDPTGKLQSPLFTLPAKLSMDVYDTQVFMRETKTGTSKNVVRIRLDKTKQIVGEYRFATTTKMTENDLIRPVTFNLADYKGQAAYIELLDSTRVGALGIGNLSPAVVSLPEKGPAQISVMQIKAAEIIGDLKVAELEPQLLKILDNPRGDLDARGAAAAALMKMAPEKNANAVSEVFGRLGESPELKQQLVVALSQSNLPAVHLTLRKGLVGTARFLQMAIAGVLAQSSQGVAQLLEAAKAGDVDADLLDDVTLKERIAANSSALQQKELDQFMQGQSGREDRKQVIAERLKSFDPNMVTVDGGKQVFTQNCSMCHQIKGVGGLIGPQLDGIGNWGQKSLTEKILNPNANISEAFRTYNITLKNGKALSGLFRREEGQVLVFANIGGQEFSVAKSDIKNQVASKYTLMPDHFRNTITKTDFDALLKFLLSTKE
jgi:putative heme-binding domain-containing protein